ADDANTACTESQLRASVDSINRRVPLWQRIGMGHFGSPYVHTAAFVAFVTVGVLAVVGALGPSSSAILWVLIVGVSLVNRVATGGARLRSGGSTLELGA